MTLEQLRIFIAVAEREHVTGAAAALHLTQSAVSAAIRALEDQHAVTLFDRVGRRVVLTDAGRQFLVAARGVLASAAEAEAVLQEMAGLKRGALRLGASQTIANYWLPGPLAAFRMAWPGIRLDLRIGNSEQVRTLVLEGAVDCGLVEDELSGDAFDMLAVAEDELVVVAPAGMVLPAQITAGYLETLPWVFRETGSGTRAMFEAALPALGVAPGALKPVLELPSNEAVLAAVVAGAGAAALSKLVVAQALASGAVRELALPGAHPVLAKRHFWLVRSGTRHVSRAEAALRQLLAERRR